MNALLAPQQTYDEAFAEACERIGGEEFGETVEILADANMALGWIASHIELPAAYAEAFRRLLFESEAKHAAVEADMKLWGAA